MTLSGEKMAESHHQVWCKAILIALHFTIYDTSQGYRREPGGTRLTPGLCDLIAFHRGLSLALFFECKPPKQAREAERLLSLPHFEVPKSATKDRKRAEAQREFGENVLAVASATDRVLYGYGSVPELVAILWPHFGLSALRTLVQALWCPLDIKQRALVVLSSPTRSTASGAGDGAGADPLEHQNHLPPEKRPE